MKIEKPGDGRAKISEIGGLLQIIIPSEKKILIIAFLLFWLSMALGFEREMIIEYLDTKEINSFQIIFMLIFGGGIFYAVFILIWFIFGYEKIDINSNIIKIERRLFGIGRKKEYSLRESNNFRLINDFKDRNKSIFFIRDDFGLIGFDYGLRTIQFGLDIEEAEAKYILQLLKSKKFPTESKVESNDFSFK